MTLLLFSMLLLAPSVNAGDCVYDAASPDVRSAIGEAIVAKRPRSDADIEALKNAVDDCDKIYDWSIDAAVHASGAAAMHFAADTIAQKLGHPAWSTEALTIIRARPLVQIQNLAKTGSGDVEFELVLTRLIGANPSVGEALNGASDETLESFILMVKLLAVSEVERRKI